MLRLGFIWILLIGFSSCEAPEPEKSQTPPDIQWDKDRSTKMNQDFARKEAENIKHYIERRNWEMDSTGTGLLYYIQHSSEADTVLPTAPAGCVALVEYQVSLLDGTVCYTSDSTGWETFMIERSELESGVHEAVQLMRVGDVGTFILPSRLAHGLIGDLEKIPQLSPLIYRIELHDLSCPGF